MELNKTYLSDEELLMILKHRQKKKDKKRLKWHKFIFTEYAIYDMRTAIIREGVKALVYYTLMKDLLNK